MIIDCGSSSTDIIPVSEKNINYSADKRLMLNEVLYIGMRRTIVQTIVNKILINGYDFIVVGEPTTTIGDINYLLGYIDDEEYSKNNGIQGKWRLLRNAQRNVARLICSDLEICSEYTIKEICNFISNSMTDIIKEKIEYVVNNNNLTKNFDFVLCEIGSKFIKEKVLTEFKDNNIYYLEDVLNLDDLEYTPALGISYLL